MAKAPGPAKPDPERATRKRLGDEAKDRLREARRQKAEYDLDIRESYFFASPHRARDVRSESKPSSAKPRDAGEAQTGLATDLCRDFVTDLVDAFMPQSEPWAERRPGMLIPENMRDEVTKKVALQDSVIFNAIRASNLYEVLPMALNPDIAIGTSALWIEDLRPAENIVVQAIPLRELEINVDPYGSMLGGDRFIVRHTKNRHIEAILPGIDLPAEIKAKVKAKPNEFTEIRWGFWRLWDRRQGVVWQHVVMVKDDVVHHAELAGEGCCSLIVFRFNPAPEWAFGNGPMVEGLPEFRQLDALEGDKVDHIELNLSPPTTYPDDSFASIEADGIVPKTAYPIRPGTEDAVKPIFDGGDMQPAIYETTELIERLERKFFQRYPRQRGKTPPTASQYLDEQVERQKEIGTPGMPFWREGPAQIFLRFKYLLEKRGVIEPVTVDGKTVSLEPYNPAQRATEQQEVAMAARYFQIVAAVFPEEFRIFTDGPKTMEKIRQKMRANLVVPRAKDDVKEALGQIGQLIEGRQRLNPADPSAAGGQ